MAARKAEPATVQSDFGSLLADVKNRIQSAQVRAVLAVNAELVRLYWDIGRVIGERQRAEGWGAAVIPRLSRALNNELPELKGFSERNIKRMVAFHRDYPQPADIVPQPVAQLPGAHRPARASSAPAANPIVPQAVAQMPELPAVVGAVGPSRHPDGQGSGDPASPLVYGAGAGPWLEPQRARRPDRGESARAAGPGRHQLRAARCPRRNRSWRSRR